MKAQAFGISSADMLVRKGVYVGLGLDRAAILLVAALMLVSLVSFLALRPRGLAGDRGEAIIAAAQTTTNRRT